jgi:hypothetical protein
MKTMAAMLNLKRSPAGIMQMPRSTWLPSSLSQ